MSRIYFHSEGFASEVRGSERAHAGILSADLFVAALGCRLPSEIERYARITEGVKDYMLDREPVEVFRPNIAFGGPWFQVEGQRIEAGAAALNTMIQTGGDPLVLMARLHGSCEEHLWVDEPDREWLANIIEHGRRLNVMRASMGWESVIEHLRNEAQPGSIVTSFSVCDQFPNAAVADWRPPVHDPEGDDWDQWYDLPDGERWRLGMAGLRARWSGLQLTPDTFRSYFYGPGTKRPISAYDISAEVWLA